MASRRRGRPFVVDASLAAVVFDWDGTAVVDRRASAAGVRDRVERLCGLGVHVAVVSGTHVGNVDGQLRARPAGPGRLLLGLNRGSELFAVTRSGPRLIRSVPETPRVAALLDDSVDTLAAALTARGLTVRIVSRRLNRRKLDLIPEDAWSDPPKSAIAELVTAVTARLRACGIEAISDVVALAESTAADCGLENARISSDGKHVEIGVTDKADSVRDILDEWAGDGVGPGLVLVAGDEFGPLGGVPGSDARMLVAPGMTVVSVGVEPEGVPAGVRHLGAGPERFREVLDEQLERRATHRVPAVDPDPAWAVVESGVDPQRHRVTETLLTVSAGGFGTRGAVEESGPASRPLVVAAGVYAGDEAGDGLLAAPDWTHVTLDPAPAADRRVLDLRTGVLIREETGDTRPLLRSMRFASLSNPGLMALRLEAGTGRVGKGPGTGSWTLTQGSGSGGVGMASSETHLRVDGLDTVERFAGFAADPTRTPSRRHAAALLHAGSEAGFDRLLCEQRRGWARRWQAVDVQISGDERTALALRFALHTLWSASGPQRELAVGARGLSGSGYSGHVFWDADLFVLPALMTVDPVAATAMVRYRLNRLGAARMEAKARGRAGARFPWESARTGRDVTPTEGFVGDERMRIRTGEQEEHITADVAWAAVRRAQWSSPSGRLSSAEGELVAETARYWASRCRVDDEGAHIESVIGPDEYHESVDDNAFTNVMARWNLRTAARRCAAHASRGERRAWEATADALVDGYRPETGTYDQFRGYAQLQPLLVADIGTPPLAADVLLGRERVAGSQLIKQPDVLMLHHLVPDEVVPGSLGANLDLYGPRTAHGSSLSPAVMALVTARAGRPDEALELLRFALHIDLDDLGGTTSAGLHVGAAGGAWQALVFGFLGARVDRGVLRFEPCLPSAWRHLEVRFRCLGADVRVRAGGEVLSVAATHAIRVARGRGEPAVAAAGEFVLLTEGDQS